MYTNDESLMEAALLTAIKSAPVLVVSLAAVYLMAKLVLGASQKADTDRMEQMAKIEEARQKTMDERHTTYFAQLREMQEASNRNTIAVVQAMDRGTEALKESNKLTAGVRELLRLQQQSTTNPQQRSTDT